MSGRVGRTEYPASRFDEMLLSDDMQTWWWPRHGGPDPTFESAARRICAWSDHYGCETRVVRADVQRISKVWMRTEQPGADWNADECEHTHPDAQPYWRVDL